MWTQATRGRTAAPTQRRRVCGDPAGSPGLCAAPRSWDRPGRVLPGASRGGQASETPRLWTRGLQKPERRISTVSSPGQVAAVTTAPAVTREDWSEAYSWGSCSVHGQNPHKPPRGKCTGGPEEPTATTPPLHWWVRQRSGNGSRCLAEASACSVLPRPQGSPPCHQPAAPTQEREIPLSTRRGQSPGYNRKGLLQCAEEGWAMTVAGFYVPAQQAVLSP